MWIVVSIYYFTLLEHNWLHDKVIKLSVADPGRCTDMIILANVLSIFTNWKKNDGARGNEVKGKRNPNVLRVESVSISTHILYKRAI